MGSALSGYPTKPRQRYFPLDEETLQERLDRRAKWADERTEEKPLPVARDAEDRRDGQQQQQSKRKSVRRPSDEEARRLSKQYEEFRKSSHQSREGIGGFRRQTMMGGNIDAAGGGEWMYNLGALEKEHEKRLNGRRGNPAASGIIQHHR